MTEPQLKLGRLPKKYDGRDLQFDEYQKKAIAVPRIFGHANTFKNWGMLGNDQYGDCVWAGFAHEVMNYTHLAAEAPVGVEVTKFTPKGVLSDYASTGFNPNTGENDNGTETRQGLNYRRKTGIIDEANKRHKIGVYVSIDPNNIKHVTEALWVFESVGIGFNFPESAMEQFNNNEPWTVKKSSEIIGGHYVPLLGKPATGKLACITWGKRQVLTEEFFREYTEEVWAYITPEEINKRTQKNWSGYNWKQLEEDLKAVTN